MTRMLVSVQQIPLELTRDELLLAFTPVHDQRRETIGGRLNRRHVWPIAIGSSVTWVTISFIFTLVNSFVSLDTSPDGGSEGLAIGFLWLWFLCLVIGWLWVPIFTCKPPEREVKAKALREDAKFVEQEPGWKPNPTHYQSTVAFQSSNESQLDHTQISASANQTVNHSTTSLSPSTIINTITSNISIHPQADTPLIDISNELSLVKRDELRLSATFNYSRFIPYLVLLDGVFRALGNPTRGNDDEVGHSGKHQILEVSH